MAYQLEVPLEPRFWAKVDKLGEHWLWQAHLIRGSYGSFALPGKQNILAHRFAWEIASGEPVPSGFWVLHTCDIRSCVRNDEPGEYVLNGIAHPRFGHLFLGTLTENTEDMVAKGRARGAAGDANGHAKLHEDDVRQIRILGESQELSLKEIGSRFGVSKDAISHVLKRRRWAHVL